MKTTTHTQCPHLDADLALPTVTPPKQAAPTILGTGGPACKQPAIAPMVDMIAMYCRGVGCPTMARLGMDTPNPYTATPDTGADGGSAKVSVLPRYVIPGDCAENALEAAADKSPSKFLATLAVSSAIVSATATPLTTSTPPCVCFCWYSERL